MILPFVVGGNVIVVRCSVRIRNDRRVCLRRSTRMVFLAFLFQISVAVHISVKDDTYHIDQIFDGETVEEVLDYVQIGRAHV